jgi:hypothetical protein
VLADAPKLRAAIAGALSGRGLAELLSRHLVLEAAAHPERVLAPSRPLVDPGRPLPFAREGGLDKLIADGFGFSAAQVKELRVGTGTVAALQRTAVPVASVDVKAPLLEGVGAERLRASLTTAIDRLTADSIGKLRQVPRGAGGAARAVREPDALDALIKQASRRAPPPPRPRKAAKKTSAKKTAAKKSATAKRGATRSKR